MMGTQIIMAYNGYILTIEWNNDIDEIIPELHVLYTR